MSLKKRFKLILQNDWAISLLLLLLFFCTHGYRFGWDDQIAEIPHLKSLIDSSLYTQDLFVISLKNYLPTHFYRVLSHFITIDQIPSVYFGLFIISRYFLFFWIYKFWRLIAQHKIYAFFCTLTAMTLVREQHFLYWTFSHAEFTYPFIFAGIYFFHKERFLLAAAILGTAVNFHALYGLYPMVYMCIYLLITCKKHGLKPLLKSILIFILCMSPFLIFIIKTKASLWVQPLSQTASEWDWISICRAYMPEHFFFQDSFSQYTLKEILSNLFLFIGATETTLFLIMLYILNITLNPDFQRQLKSHVMVLSAFALLGVCFIASYIIPNKFILGLQLLRNAHFILFLLPGYTMLFLLKTITKQRLWICSIIGFFFVAFVQRNLTSALCALMIVFLVLLNTALDKDKNKRKILSILLFGAGFILTTGIYITFLHIANIHLFRNNVFRIHIISLLCLNAIIGFQRLKKIPPLSKQFFIIVPLLFMTSTYVFSNYQRLTRDKNPFDVLIESWEDIQRQTKKLTPKDAVILIPYDMLISGFRMHSERAIICADTDIGVFLAFDTARMPEWQQRMHDIASFKTSADSDLKPAIFNAVIKYNASYIVFPPKIAPPSSKTLQLLYQNQLFSLYKINIFESP